MSDILLNEGDKALKSFVADVACCHIDTVEAILAADTYLAKDKRGHQQERGIGIEQEEEIKTNVIQELKAHLEQEIPVSSKDVRSWLKENNDISMNQHRVWGIFPSTIQDSRGWVPNHF